MNYLDELFEKYCNREYDEQAMASYPINDMHEENFKKALTEALGKQRERIIDIILNKAKSDYFVYITGLIEAIRKDKLEEL